MVRIWECLYVSMIGDRYGWMSPFYGALDDIFYLGNAIHVTHLGMTMQLDPLLRTVIDSAASKIWNFLNPHNRANGKFSVEAVNGGDPFQL